MARSVQWHNVMGDLSLSALLLSRWKPRCLSQPLNKNSSQLSHLPEQFLFWALVCRRYCAYWLAVAYCPLTLLGNILLLIIARTDTGRTFQTWLQQRRKGCARLWLPLQVRLRRDWCEMKRKLKKECFEKSPKSEKTGGLPDSSCQ